MDMRPCSIIQPSAHPTGLYPAQPCLPAQVDPGVRLYHALWDAYEHPAAPPSAGPRACPDGYEQARASAPCAPCRAAKSRLRTRRVAPACCCSEPKGSCSAT